MPGGTNIRIKSRSIFCPVMTRPVRVQMPIDIRFYPPRRNAGEGSSEVCQSPRAAGLRSSHLRNLGPVIDDAKEIVAAQARAVSRCSPDQD